MSEESGMRPDERDRLTRLETKLDYIIAHMQVLQEKADDFTKFKDNLRERIAWISGAFAILFTGFTYVAKWVWTTFTIGLNNG